MAAVFGTCTTWEAIKIDNYSKFGIFRWCIVTLKNNWGDIRQQKLVGDFRGFDINKFNNKHK